MTSDVVDVPPLLFLTPVVLQHDSSDVVDVLFRLFLTLAVRLDMLQSNVEYLESSLYDVELWY